jgi:hypothetical protein
LWDATSGRHNENKVEGNGFRCIYASNFASLKLPN